MMRAGLADGDYSHPDMASRPRAHYIRGYGLDSVPCPVPAADLSAAKRACHSAKRVCHSAAKRVCHSAAKRV